MENHDVMIRAAVDATGDHVALDLDVVRIAEVIRFIRGLPHEIRLIALVRVFKRIRVIQRGNRIGKALEFGKNLRTLRRMSHRLFCYTL